MTHIQLSDAMLTALQASGGCPSVPVLPSVIVTDIQLPEVREREGIATAQFALQYLEAHGFEGDRSVVQNLRGYGKRLRELSDPVPWLEDEHHAPLLINQAIDTEDLDHKYFNII